jgi:hypothetical protein
MIETSMSVGARLGAGQAAITPVLIANSVSPSTGWDGTTLTISGFGFNDDTEVEVDGEECVVVGVVARDAVSCSVPAGTDGDTVDVAVTVNGLRVVLAGSFTYTSTLSVTHVNPSIGRTAGGETVTVIGTGFVNGDTAVAFGTETAVCSFISVTAMSCVTPEAADGLSGGGAVDVTVAVEGGGLSDVLVDGFTYFAPSISLGISYSSPEKTGISMGGLPGTLYADYVTANVITDNLSGYNLTIESSQPNLECIDGANTYWLNALSGPPSPPSPTLNNTWGYGIGSGLDGLTVPSSWTGVTSSPVVFKNFASVTNPTLGDDTTIWFGTQYDHMQPACGSYGGTVTITAVGN